MEVMQSDIQRLGVLTLMSTPVDMHAITLWSLLHSPCLSCLDFPSGLLLTSPVLEDFHLLPFWLFYSMELASSLSTDEIKQSLREIAKKSGKNIPLTKYLCIPSSKQLQKRIPVWNASSPLLSLLKHALHLYGDVPTTRETGQSKDTSNKHSVSYEGVKGSPQHYPKKHSRVLKDVKLKLSADPNHKLFWSHVIFGANQISRALESSQRFNEAELASRTHLLECVLLDAEWITSQMGHHIAHLCADLGIRLVSVTPAGELASCLSTPLHPMKKAIAVGIRSSVNTPPELIDWIAKLKMELEPLALPIALDAALHPPSTASSNSPVSVQSVPTKSQTSVSGSFSHSVHTHHRYNYDIL
ncbi:unnamed protein product [Dicrocoelium dendriticum]|nr:unnamed protein product [Dicrocoelium dendriticum]